MPLLQVNNLSTSYKNQNGYHKILDNVNFTINHGESIGIAGESACGKSTLGLTILRMLNGGKVDSGDIIFDGKSILNISDQDFNHNYRWKKISMIFQGAINSLDPVFTIKQQMYEILSRHNYSTDFNQAVSSAMNSVHLDLEILDRYPHELSGGMLQRIVIAMAIILKPVLIIADEPTTSLDVLIQAQIINLFKELKKQGISFLIITHDLGILSELSDKVAIMYAGQIIEFGSSVDVYNNPAHPYTQALLSSIPKLSGPKPKSIPGTIPDLVNIKPGCRFGPRCEYFMDKCKKNVPNFPVKDGYSSCWLSE